jgi:alkylhydroperoxidase/carboxymuconolactone decarboxylase family protein YurZ
MSTIEKYRRSYEELFGAVPPRVAQRMALGDEVDPKLLELVEESRQAALFPAAFDTKTTQLMVFGILLGQLSNGASLHAKAAVRAGATKAELHAVVGLAYLYRGLSAFNMGAEMIDAAFGE